jgi:hypothetical protein
MNQNLRDTLVRKLEKLSDETARQLLDYVEFLESKYHRSVRQRSTLERFADGIEDTLTATRISKAAFKGTAQVLDAAGNVMRGVVAAGQAVVDEIQSEDDGAAQAPPERQASDREDPPPATQEAAEERLTKE